MARSRSDLFQDLCEKFGVSLGIDKQVRPHVVVHLDLCFSFL
jgi:hypothetical protein